MLNKPPPAPEKTHVLFENLAVSPSKAGRRLWSDFNGLRIITAGRGWWTKPPSTKNALS